MKKILFIFVLTATISCIAQPSPRKLPYSINVQGTVEAEQFIGDGSLLTGVSGSGDMEKSVYDPLGIIQQMVGTTATQTLTNKTLISPIIIDPTGIDADDISVTGTTNKFATTTLINKWNAKQEPITLTTTGTSGLATFIGNILNIPNYSPVAEVNNLSSAVTWTNVPDANITESSVTQHEGALSLTANQISDFDTEVSNNSSVAANTAKVSFDWDYDYTDLINKPTIPTSLAAANITVSPAIGGNTDAYAVMLANRTSIDSIQANMSSGVNTALRTVTSTAGVFTEAYNETQPNLQLLLDEDTEVTITDALNGNFIILEVYNNDVSEDDFTVTLKGTNEDLIAVISHDERAYFTMTANPDDEILWLRSYVDGKTDKVINVTGTGGTTIDWSISPYYNFVHGAMNDTLVFVAPKSSKKLRLTRTQDATGSRTLAYASTLFASGGTLPTLTTTANATDVIHLFYDKENDRYSIEDVELNLQSIAGTPLEPQLTQISTSGATFGSSGHVSLPPSNSFDGNTSTYSSTTLAQSGWISIDFGTAVTVEKIELLARQGGGTNTARINGTQLRWSNDGTTWTNIGTPVSGVDDTNYMNWIVKTFTPITARYFGWINTSSATYSGNVSEAKFWGNE